MRIVRPSRSRQGELGVALHSPLETLEEGFPDAWPVELVVHVVNPARPAARVERLVSRLTELLAHPRAGEEFPIPRVLCLNRHDATERLAGEERRILGR